MYRLDWFEQLKLRQAKRIDASRIGGVSPIVWALGITSLLTDVSSEMVNSILPVYLFLHLRLSPLQYGAIDGVYNGLSIALVGFAAGFAADRWRRHKHVAGVGYAVSAVCKLLLIAAAGVWTWIMAVVALDRLGKGVRTAPRDAMISLSTPPQLYGTAYGVHRALDSLGALIGPIVGFALLARIAGNFDVLWLASFLIALLGVAALWLFVPSRAAPAPGADAVVHTDPPAGGLRRMPALRRFLVLAGCGTLCAAFTISDGFLYLLLQQKGGTNPGYVPLFYVVTALGYMLFALPLGLAADRFGRRGMFVAGYAVLAVVYGTLLAASTVPPALQVACVVLLGLYYAATEGVLMALASAIVPAAHRATGLAVLVSCIGGGKLLSSVGFGWLWQRHGENTSLLVFLIGTVVALSVTFAAFRTLRHD